MRLLIAFLLLAGLALWAWSLPAERPRAVRGEVEVPAEAEGGAASVPAPPPAQTEPPAGEKAPGTPIPPPPEDPVGEGDCSLRLALTDRDSGEPVRGTARLYRLDAPGNEHWTRGDQLQCTIDVVAGGTLVEKLPEGLYRIHCLDQPAKSEDPGAFLVSGALTRRTLAIPRPRKFAATLVVVNENGRAFDRGTLRGGSVSHTDRRAEPEWRVARALREPDKYFGGMGFGAGAMGGRSIRRALAVDGVFRIGRYREDSRRSEKTVRWRWQGRDCTEVHVTIGCGGARDRAYFGIAVPIEPIRRSILLPDGGLAIERGARIEAWQDAWEGEPRALHDAVLKVKATLDGYEPLEFELRADEAPPVKTMVAKASE